MITVCRGVAIAAEHVSKTFGYVEALRDASIKAENGEIVARFGDNGAGKSTFQRILQGIYRPDNGQVIVANEPTSTGTCPISASPMPAATFRPAPSGRRSRSWR